MLRLPVALFLSPMIITAPVAAQDVPSGPVSVSGGVQMVSDYRFRGLSLSDSDVAVQPRVTVSHDSGFYLGVWGSNIDNSGIRGKAEVDIYGGYEAYIASGTRIDVGMTYYWYPDGSKAIGASDYGEGTLRLSYLLGPVEATGTVAYAWDQDALGSDDNLYLNLGLSGGIPNTPVTVMASVGHSDGALARGRDYFDWSLGASAVFGTVTAGVKYVDTDLAKTGVKAVDKLSDPTLILSLGVAF
jgi:uncharacterized protein (TIGR02001 family)